MKLFLFAGLIFSLPLFTEAQQLEEGGSRFGSQRVIIETETKAAVDIRADDLDNDGDIDVLTASYLDNKIAWYKNDGKGNFSSQQIINSEATEARAVYTADLNGDGNPDVLSAHNNQVAWYANEGAGNFGEEQLITVLDNWIESVYATDLDNDGDIDVLSASYDTKNSIAWYENDGHGGFGALQIISDQASGAEAVYAADLDGDGDQDVLSASLGDSKIAWYENDGQGNFGLQQVITSQASDAQDVYAIDIDSDGDVDVLSASINGAYIAWYSNDGQGNFGSQQTISSQASNARSVFAKDLDDDGDIDVLSASGSGDDHKIAWYENLGDGRFGEQQVITTEAVIPHSVYVADLDGDGDQDILSASYRDNKTAWYRNYGQGNFGPQQIITSDVLGLRSMLAVDLDDDGDQDVLSASSANRDHKIAWYTNDGSGSFEPQQVISTQAEGVKSMHTADLDGDGDQDILSASYAVSNYPFTDRIAWYENDGRGVFSPQRVISTLIDDVRALYAADLDGDGDQDVLSASHHDNKIAWYKNDGDGNFDTQQVISNQTDDASSVYAIDLDGDGDQDVLSASAHFFDDNIAWYENDGVGNFSEKKGITSEATLAQKVYAADLDGDGDQDVLSASKQDNKIAWYKNDGVGNFGPQIIISLQAKGASDIYVADLDEDGDQDVLSASPSDNKIAWYENDGTGNFGPQQVIMTENNAGLVYATDLDGDGDQDVLSASGFDEYRIAWYENLRLYRVALEASICQGDTLIFGEQPLTETGTYSHTFTSIHGYDSTVVLNLSLVPTFKTVHKETICQEDSLFIAGHYRAEPGIYVDSLQSGLGCDSVVITELNVSFLEPEIHYLNDTLFSSLQVTNLQWIDCSTNEAIPGATNFYLTPSPGRYAVKASSGNCEFVSECFSVLVTGIDNQASTEYYIVSPNPTQSYVKISTKEGNLKFAQIINTSGVTVFQQSINGLYETEVDLSILPPGIYTVVLIGKDDSVVKKIIKL